MRLFSTIAKRALGIIANGKIDLKRRHLKSNDFLAKMFIPSENIPYRTEIFMYILVHCPGLIMYCGYWGLYRENRLQYVKLEGNSFVIRETMQRYMTILPIAGFFVQIILSWLRFYLHWNGYSFWTIFVAFEFALIGPTAAVQVITDWNDWHVGTPISDIGPTSDVQAITDWNDWYVRTPRIETEQQLFYEKRKLMTTTR